MPFYRGEQLKSFLVLILRLITFNFFFSFRSSNKDLKYLIKDGSKIFVLDLREAIIDLHTLGTLIQFFQYLSTKYEVFEIWVDDNSFRYNQYKNFSKEFFDLLDFVSNTINCKIIKKNSSDQYNKDTSFLKISFTKGNKVNGKFFADSEVIRKFFLEKLNFESKPINFSIENFIKNNPDRKDLVSLKKILKENFTIIFYPTYDEFLRYEKKSRKFGVISEKNFKYLEDIYISILNEIKIKKLKNIKIVLFNKKSLNWTIDENCIDLRNFENYNLTFPQVFGLFNDNCNWTLGSEGTIGFILVLCTKLKHILFVDNSHWIGATNSDNFVPLFYNSREDINYKNKPYQYIPASKEDVLKKIFNDYNNFLNSNENNLS